MTDTLLANPETPSDFFGPTQRAPQHAPPEPRIAFQFDLDSPWLVLDRGIEVELALDAQQCRVPNTPPWFQGLLNLRGQLAPVFDVAAWLGRRCEVPNRRPILVGKGEQAGALLCFGEPRLLMWSRPVAVGAEAPERLRGFVSAFARAAEGPAYLFDHRRWFAAAGHERFAIS